MQHTSGKEINLLEQDEFWESKEAIKNVYQDIKRMVDMNDDLWIIPIELYNQIFKKIEHLDRALKQARESREMWRKRFEDIKNKMKSESLKEEKEIQNE